MLLEHEIKKLMNELIHTEVAQIDLNGSNITIKTFEEGDKISLSTPVYFGGNYIPKSVRNCINSKAPFESYAIRTTLKVDEENYRIYLHYVGGMLGVSEVKFVQVLEDFSSLAARWKEFLDEHDQNDLVRVPVK